MLKWLVIAAAAYILYRLFANDILKKRKRDSAEEQEDISKKVASGEMVKDPQCGAYVSKTDSITVRDGQNIYHFCSYDCREKFLQSLQKGGRSISTAGKGEE